MSWYCDVAPGHPLHGPYHDQEYGFPVGDDVVLFERLCLEIFQAGLSWLIVLKRRPAFRTAFHGFDPVVVAAFDDDDLARLMADASIIRNRRKIEAIIANARRVVDLQATHGSFAAWIEGERRDADGHLRDKASWTRVFRDTFRFMGEELVGEFLMSIGMLPGAHHEACPVFHKIAERHPRWMDTAK
ncbi:MAG: DNA-3-methyladenine glycosylase I [Alphaproteobacteria bacterium]